MIDGLRIGHTTDPIAHTGCTVVLLPDGTVASGEVRGGAPATREFALLEATRTVDRIDAVSLSGGSTFGLAAAEGVIRWHEEQGRGFPTGAGPIPIVVGMSLFDLIGLPDRNPSVRPTAHDGYAACAAAVAADEAATGRVGAGTGATTGKHLGEHAGPGGLGIAWRKSGALSVVAVVAVNAYGSILGDGEHAITDSAAVDRRPTPSSTGEAFSNTTIGVVVTNATLRKDECFLLAQSAHDGYARALDPSHTRFDGDAVVAAATGGVARAGEGDVDVARELACNAMAAAIRSVAGA